jgi:hypothetical protein
MISLILYGGLALVVAAVVVAILVVVLPDDTVAVAARDAAPTGLPSAASISAQDINQLRLPVGLRGYRMVDTDAVLDRLSAEIDRRDQEITRLRLGGPASSNVTPTEPTEPPSGADGSGVTGTGVGHTDVRDTDAAGTDVAGTDDPRPRQAGDN